MLIDSLVATKTKEKSAHEDAFLLGGMVRSGHNPLTRFLKEKKNMQLFFLCKVPYCRIQFIVSLCWYPPTRIVTTQVLCVSATTTIGTTLVALLLTTLSMFLVLASLALLGSRFELAIDPNACPRLCTFCHQFP